MTHPREQYDVRPFQRSAGPTSTCCARATAGMAYTAGRGRRHHARHAIRTRAAAGGTRLVVHRPRRVRSVSNTFERVPRRPLVSRIIGDGCLEPDRGRGIAGAVGCSPLEIVLPTPHAPRSWPARTSTIAVVALPREWPSIDLEATAVTRPTWWIAGSGRRPMVDRRGLADHASVMNQSSKVDASRSGVVRQAVAPR
jgi:hypothetical protein